MQDEEVLDSTTESPNADSDVVPSEDNEIDLSVASNKETPTASQKRLEDTEKALKERQKEFHELSKQVAELKGQLSVIGQQKPEQQKDWLDDESLAASLRDDPSKAIDILKRERQNMLQQVVGVLEARDKYYNEQLARNNPELVAMRDKITELRKDPDFEGFSDQQLVTILKKSGGERKQKQYRGAPGGQRYDNGSEDKVRDSDLYKRIYGENQLLFPPKKGE